MFLIIFRLLNLKQTIQSDHVINISQATKKRKDGFYCLHNSTINKSKGEPPEIRVWHRSERAYRDGNRFPDKTAGRAESPHKLEAISL